MIEHVAFVLFLFVVPVLSFGDAISIILQSPFHLLAEPAYEYDIYALPNLISCDFSITQIVMNSSQIEPFYFVLFVIFELFLLFCVHLEWKVSLTAVWVRRWTELVNECEDKCVLDPVGRHGVTINKHTFTL